MPLFSEEILWNSIKQHIDRNMELMDVSFEKGYILFSFDNPDFPSGKSSTSAHIREYTTTLGIHQQHKGCNGRPDASLDVYASLAPCYPAPDCAHVAGTKPAH